MSSTQKNNSLKFSYKNHIIIILIFFAFTSILTFPVIANFGTDYAGEGINIWNNVWKWWWISYSADNNLDWLSTNYLFYPDGIDILQYNALPTLIAYTFSFLEYNIIWNLIWFAGFVFGGYGCFLLSYHFNRNFTASLVAGTIFAFSTYHTTQATQHIGLALIIWFPFSLLYLFKSSESKSKLNPILAGVFLFLIILTQLNYFFVMIILLVIFITVYLIRKKPISNKTFVTNLFVAGVVFSVLAAPLLFSVFSTFSETQSYQRPFSEINLYSLSLENMFLIPSKLHSIHQASDFAYSESVYDIFDKPITNIQMEQVTYLGFASIILSSIAIIWFRHKNYIFWMILLVIFLVLSLGPELKIFDELTGYLMPGKILYDEIPGWDFNRAPARFIVIATLSLAILSSFTISEIIKKHFQSTRKIALVGGIALFVIMLELSTVPYPTTSLDAPSIYEEIKNDPRNVAILDAPIGGFGYLALQSDTRYQYFQTIHEKPIYGGFAARPSLDAQRNLQGYFLNQFMFDGSINDIVKQDISKVGLSLFEYHNIGYVIIHKDPLVSMQMIPALTQQMNQIIDSPFYENSKMIIYKIPKNDSIEPFITLGSGWDQIHLDNLGSLVRLTEPDSQIILINPNDEIESVSLEILMEPISESNHVLIESDEILFEADLVGQKLIVLENIDLLPGENIIFIKSSEFTILPPSSEAEFERKISLIVDSITFA